MKILDNGVIREMTTEEIEQIFQHSQEENMTETEQKAAAYDILTGVSA